MTGREALKSRLQIAGRVTEAFLPWTETSPKLADQVCQKRGEQPTYRDPRSSCAETGLRSLSETFQDGTRIIWSIRQIRLPQG